MTVMIYFSFWMNRTVPGQICKFAPETGMKCGCQITKKHEFRGKLQHKIGAKPQQNTRQAWGGVRICQDLFNSNTSSFWTRASSYPIRDHCCVGVLITTAAHAISSFLVYCIVDDVQISCELIFALCGRIMYVDLINSTGVIGVRLMDHTWN